MVKFKNKNEYEEFISSIDMYETTLHSKWYFFDIFFSLKRFKGFYFWNLTNW